MTDYNDGNWHGWNGGECPVHQESIVEYVWVQDGRTGITERKAGEDRSGATPAWSGPVKAFRVIKQHREPREWWLGGNEFFRSKLEAESDGWINPVHVREVLE